jgi:glycosyltransferase involved in cell wall biosynthesis
VKDALLLERHIWQQTAEPFSPVRICEIELSESLSAISAFAQDGNQRYQRAHCLVRLHSQPIGLVDFPFVHDELTPGDYMSCIWQELGEQINAHLRADSLPEVRELAKTGLSWAQWAQTPRCVEEREAFLKTAPFVTVVLCTRDRPDRLQRVLTSLLAQQYPGYEVIVVDNAPSTTATADLIERQYGDEAKIRYVREDRPGLSAARNRGVKEAQGEIIAFTDDDVVVDSFWLAGLVRGFSATEKVICVTGLLVPLELETPTQLWFEEFGGFNKGFMQSIFDQKSGKKDSPLYPFTAGRFGTGASMAFTADFLRQEKGFDCALGAGTLTGGGEDLVAFFRVIMSGNRLVYTPASLAYHEHRRDYPSLQKQIYYYGASVTAYLTKIVLDHPLLLFQILIRVPQGLFFMFSARSTKNQKKTTDFPKELTGVERKGLLLGPVLYIRGRLKSR